MIQKFPKHPDLADALFYVGKCYEQGDDSAKATKFYRKILTMASPDSCAGSNGTSPWRLSAPPEICPPPGRWPCEVFPCMPAEFEGMNFGKGGYDAAFRKGGTGYRICEGYR